MVSSQEDRTGSISWLFRTFTVLSLWGVMGGGYNLCVHNIIHICMYIFLLHIYIYKYNYIIYIRIYTLLYMQYIIVQQYITVYLHSIYTKWVPLLSEHIRAVRCRGPWQPRQLDVSNRQIRQAQWIQCIHERRKVILRLLLKAERIRRLFPCPDVVLNTDRLVFQRHTWTFFLIGLLSFLSFSIWTT